MTEDIDDIDWSPSKELGTIPGYVVVLSRSFYSFIVSAAITYGVCTYLLGLQVSVSAPVETLVAVIAVFSVVSFTVIGVGYWLWVGLSWATAWLFCPSVRRMWDEYKEHQNSERGETNGG